MPDEVGRHSGDFSAGGPLPVSATYADGSLSLVQNGPCWEQTTLWTQATA